MACARHQAIPEALAKQLAAEHYGLSGDGASARQRARSEFSAANAGWPRICAEDREPHGGSRGHEFADRSPGSTGRRRPRPAGAAYLPGVERRQRTRDRVRRRLDAGRASVVVSRRNALPHRREFSGAAARPRPMRRTDGAGAFRLPASRRQPQAAVGSSARRRIASVDRCRAGRPTRAGRTHPRSVRDARASRAVGPAQTAASQRSQSAQHRRRFRQQRARSRGSSTSAT